MKSVSFAICALFGLLVAPSAGFADIPENLQACPTIADPSDRLACYDAAMMALAAAPREAVSDPVSAEVQQQPRVAAEADRGFLPNWFPKVNRPEPSDKDAVEDPDSYETKIVKIVRNNIGRYYFTTEEGFVWRQVELGRIYTPRSLPTEATIRQGALGSTRMSIDSIGRTYRVERVE